MKQAIKHFRKLLTCEQFIITGSYAFRALGLIDKVTDLDIILVKPTEETKEILKKLKVEQKNDYPEDESHFVVYFDDIKIDFFCYSETIKHPIRIMYDGMDLFLQPIKEIIEAKKRCSPLKHTLQLKALASLFMSEAEFQKTLHKEMTKTLQPIPMKSTPLPEKKEDPWDEDEDWDLDEDEYKPPKKKS